MSDTEIRIAIAEEYGWQDCKWSMHYQVPMGTKDNKAATVIMQELPDYPNDLNAMAEVETAMSFSVRQKYYNALRDVWRCEAGTYVADIELVRSTARQRSEAALRAKGLWK
jgi:hypothetical protein